MIQPDLAVEYRMEKDYGRLTSDQFHQLIGTLPELRQQRDEVGRHLAESPREKLHVILVGGFNWGEIYEYSFAEHISIAVIAFNAMPMLAEAMPS